MTNKLNERNKALFQQTYLRALLDNKNYLNQWKSYKEKYEEVIKTLNFYNEKSKHSVCIPLGKKAFVKGQLVHTNDVWVTLGCGWFLKTSSKKAVEICERRIKHANELVDKWESESKLLESMRDYSVNKNVFDGEDSKDIFEPFDENQEKNWKKEHKEKEQKYRQQLKELREKTGSVSLNDEKDIWEHLEALELQEELEDELNRLGDDTSSDDNESDSDDISINEDDVPSGDSEDGYKVNSLQQNQFSQSKIIDITNKGDVPRGDTGDGYKVNSLQQNQFSQSKIIDITNTDVKTECTSDMIETSKTRTSSKCNEETFKQSGKRVTFEISDNIDTNLNADNARSEHVQDAVLDIVKENLVAACNSGNESEQKRPISKFKMKRNVPK